MTRCAPDGLLLLLEEQDRVLWDRPAIDEGIRLVREALRGCPGRFALQAAIAALHAQAPSYQTTDWPKIVRLYDLLGRAWPSPVVALNRAVAVAMADGPAAAWPSWTTWSATAGWPATGTCPPPGQICSAGGPGGRGRGSVPGCARANGQSC